MRLTVQYIPGHIGIMGNEKADDGAKMPSNNKINTLKIMTIPTLEAIILIKQTILEKWRYDFDSETRNKAAHYKCYKWYPAI